MQFEDTDFLLVKHCTFKVKHHVGPALHISVDGEITSERVIHRLSVRYQGS